MRAYRITWLDIHGRKFCHLVLDDNDVCAENKIQESYSEFRQFISTEYLPFDFFTL